MPNYRYGRYVYGPDPLALPFDVRGAVDEMGDAILAGANPADALRELLRRGVRPVDVAAVPVVRHGK